MAKDYYVILGVAPDAAAGEIKKAYRRIAKECHPDTGNCQGAGRFREIQEAYDTLGDADRRKAYDDGRGGRKTTRPRTAGRPVHTQPYRRIIPRHGPRNAVHRFEDTQQRYEIWLEPEEAAAGGNYQIIIQVPVRCPDCGERMFRPWPMCRRCGGTGLILSDMPVQLMLPAQIADGTLAVAHLANEPLPPVRIGLYFRVRRHFP